MNRTNLNKLLLLILVLLAVSLACGGSSNEGTVITPNAPTESSNIDTGENTESGDISESEEQPEDQGPRLETYSVGELIEVQDQTIRLNSIEYQGSVLLANFSVENLGSSDLTVSSLLSFSAKKDDGTLLEQEIFGCGASGLDGTILPGDRLRGDICWSGASQDDGIRIYYEASLFGQGAIVWDAVEGAAEEIEGSDALTTIEVFLLGDVIEVQEQTIRLNSVSYQGAVLMADFTIENHGSSDVNTSSMLSFSAKTGEGIVLDQEIFDCGTSNLDGKILSGDRLRGQICWSGASPDDDIRIYFEAELLDEGAIVWDAIEGEAEPYEGAPLELGVDTYAVGELVQVDSHTITLNSVEFQGNVIKANFTVENQGAKDLNISSVLQFYVRKNDGTSLEQEIFSCGTTFDGSVIPGDKLTGDICWSDASVEDGLKIYYEAELFASGAVVWLIE